MFHPLILFLVFLTTTFSSPLIDQPKPDKVPKSSFFPFKSPDYEYVEEAVSSSSNVTERYARKQKIEMYCFIKKPLEDIDDHLKKPMNHCNITNMACEPNFDNLPNAYDYFCRKRFKNNYYDFNCKFEYFSRQKTCKKGKEDECFAVHLTCFEDTLQVSLTFLSIGCGLIVFLLAIACILYCKVKNRVRSRSYHVNEAPVPPQMKVFTT